MTCDLYKDARRQSFGRMLRRPYTAEMTYSTLGDLENDARVYDRATTRNVARLFSLLSQQAQKISSQAYGE